MHLHSLILAALGVTFASASHLTIITRQDTNFLGGLHQGVWTTNNPDENYDIDTDNGCYDTGVPGVQGFCMDMNNKRAHFFDGSRKRCFREWREQSVGSCMKGICSIGRWNEVTCDW
ncbi:hypothetical protein B0T16DRAFT_457335 [Cercophora newfieldiana]|uniref:Uncharacterized protein n=1 Tax=Cercophora newfieldiana TaxID=92897 RepID=A0AA39YCV3_9PEZI|nr:hypothetical protein B0T16DRAFT_457335 [Cercophora newfieldiana]